VGNETQIHGRFYHSNAERSSVVRVTRP
jgi:hypothetical protein